MVVDVMYERLDDPQGELVRSRAEFDALGQRLGVMPPEFAGHREEYQWWFDLVGKHTHDDAVDDAARFEAAMALSRWHTAWIVAQPQWDRAAALTDLGRRLQTLGEYLKDPELRDHLLFLGGRRRGHGTRRDHHLSHRAALR